MFLFGVETLAFIASGAAAGDSSEKADISIFGVVASAASDVFDKSDIDK